MQRWTAALFLAAVAAFVVLAFQSRTPPPAAATTAPSVSATGAPAPAGGDAAVASGNAAGDGVAAGDVPPSTGDVAPPAPAESGEAAPPLGSAAPRMVVFGAVIVEYRGAQGVPRTARSKEEAAAMAKEIATLGKEDFAKAVARGDKGSLENLGTMPRGVFEPLVEYALFSLGVGEVSEPIDSPRGFYVFKRIE